jgi:photosystem II stability/assembly factor-like uncharacterized protein
MIENKIFLAPAGSGLARAEYNANGVWSVALLLENEKVSCLTAVPPHPNTLYAGTQGSGVFRSDDRGQNWRPAGLAGQIVKSLAANPRDPNVVYAGTKPPCVYISRDGGASWTELEAFRRIRGRRFWFSPAEPPDRRAYVQAIAISPTDPDVVMAGIEFGAVVRSADGGQSWSNHIKNTLRDCHDLKFHAANGNWAYEAGGTGGGAAFSRDGGVTWRKAKSGLAKHYGVACAADPKRPEVWYVSVAPNPGQAYGEQAEAYLYRMSGGAGWQPIGWHDHPLPQMPIALATVPDAPGHLFAGLTYGDVWHSADCGESWQKLPLNLGGVWRSMIVI